jgi:hypothetical protein
LLALSTVVDCGTDSGTSSGVAGVVAYRRDKSVPMRMDEARKGQRGNGERPKHAPPVCSADSIGSVPLFHGDMLRETYEEHSRSAAVEVALKKRKSALLLLFLRRERAEAHPAGSTTAHDHREHRIEPDRRSGGTETAYSSLRVD